MASLLLTTGGASISCGKFRTACATLSRTSFAAASKFSPTLNSTVILLRPTWLDEVIERIPGIPFTAFSIGSVTWLSIISLLAPAYDVLTLIVGGSIAGYSLTAKKVYPTTPKRTINRFNTVASTGRLRDNSEIFIPLFL